MRALVLAGGYGTRLGAIARDRSKVLLPIAGRPVIDYVLGRLAELPQVHQALVVTNQRFHREFEDWATGGSWPFSVTVLNDGATSPENRLGAVGDVLFGIESAPADDDLLVMAGDNLCDFPLDRMAAMLTGKGSCIALFDVGQVQNASKFNNLKLDPAGRVIEFEEKPRNPTSSLVAVAIYMFRRSDVHLFSEFRAEGHDLDLLGGFIAWVQQRTPLYACLYGPEFHWWDIGDLAVYEQASRHYQTARLPAERRPP